jgi:hypothetical protein
MENPVKLYLLTDLLSLGKCRQRRLVIGNGGQKAHSRSAQAPLYQLLRNHDTASLCAFEFKGSSASLISRSLLSKDLYILSANYAPQLGDAEPFWGASLDTTMKQSAVETVALSAELHNRSLQVRMLFSIDPPRYLPPILELPPELMNSRSLIFQNDRKRCSCVQEHAVSRAGMFTITIV